MTTPLTTFENGAYLIHAHFTAKGVVFFFISSDALLADLESTTHAQQVNLRLTDPSDLYRSASMTSQGSGVRYSLDGTAGPNVELRRMGAPPAAVKSPPSDRSYVSLRDNMQELDSMLKDLDQPDFVDDINRKSDCERPGERTGSRGCRKRRGHAVNCQSCDHCSLSSSRTRLFWS